MKSVAIPKDYVMRARTKKLIRYWTPFITKQLSNLEIAVDELNGRGPLYYNYISNTTPQHNTTQQRANSLSCIAICLYLIST